MKYAVVLVCTGYLGRGSYVILQDHTALPFSESSELPEDVRVFSSERSAARYAKAYKGDALLIPTGSFKVLHVEHKYWKIPCGGCGFLMDSRVDVALCEDCRTLSTKEVSWVS